MSVLNLYGVFWAVMLILGLIILVISQLFIWASEELLPWKASMLIGAGLFSSGWAAVNGYDTINWFSIMACGVVLCGYCMYVLCTEDWLDNSEGWQFSLIIALVMICAGSIGYYVCDQPETDLMRDNTSCLTSLMLWVGIAMHE